MKNEARRILIIDDNQDVADMLAALLSMHGYATLSAYGGSEGLLAAEQFAPDIVFLDLGMPGMTGFQVAAALRELEAAHWRPFLIAFTAWNDPDTKDRVAEAGFDLHLTKTSAPLQLLRAIQHAAC